MDLSKLTSEQLVEILNKNGFNVSSINNAQRQIYEKRLLKKLSENDKVENVISEPVLIKEEINVSESILIDDVLNHLQNNQIEEINEAPFFAVQIPNIKLPEASLIFTNIKKAKIFCKDYPDARFKVFKNLKDAENFTQEMSPEPIKLEQVLNLEGSVFPSIKYEEIFKMKKKIVEGNIEEVQKYFYLNPRYLISSGDTPTIYQEGNRYNALHLASFNNQPAMCSLILNTLSDNWFLESMYPNVSLWMIDERRKNILDLYLNMPDKELNETPLHFASKFGFVDVVKVLISHSYIDRYLKNKYNEIALDIACSRINNNAKEDLKKEIMNAFEEQFYTIILRSDDEPATLSAVISSQELAKLSPKSETFPKFDLNSPYVTPKKKKVPTATLR